MSDKRAVTFYFDPICPYSYRTFLWIREARNHRPLEIDWRFLSLKSINENTGNVKESHAMSTPAFRLMAKARNDFGNEYVELLYASVGRLRHEEKQDISQTPILHRAAEEAGVDPALVSRALDDETTFAAIQEDHDSGIARGAFGVASIEIDGDGRAFFGPVISEVIRGEKAGELWDHFAWITRQEEFYEIKRERH